MSASPASLVPRNAAQWLKVLEPDLHKMEAFARAHRDGCTPAELRALQQSLARGTPAQLRALYADMLEPVRHALELDKTPAVNLQVCDRPAFMALFGEIMEPLMPRATAMNDALLTLGLIPAGTNLVQEFMANVNEDTLGVFLPTRRSVAVLTDVALIDQISIAIEEQTHALQDVVMGGLITTRDLTVASGDEDLALSAAMEWNAGAVLDAIVGAWASSDPARAATIRLVGRRGGPLDFPGSGDAPFTSRWAQDAMEMAYYGAAERAEALARQGDPLGLGLIRQPARSIADLLDPREDGQPRGRPGQPFSLGKVYPGGPSQAETTNSLGRSTLDHLSTLPTATRMDSLLGEQWAGDQLTTWQLPNGKRGAIWSVTFEDPLEAERLLDLYRTHYARNGTASAVFGHSCVMVGGFPEAATQGILEAAATAFESSPSVP